MKIFYDTEFLDNGTTIDLISIGMVREDGRELYLVNKQAPWTAIYHHEWLVENVVPSLPPPAEWHSEETIRAAVGSFCGAPHLYSAMRGVLKDGFEPKVFTPEFWAYYSAYDHVALCQLFGGMIHLPQGWPQYTRDFKQLVDMAPHFRLNKQREEDDGEHEHNALGDARWLKREYDRFHSEEL